MDSKDYGMSRIRWKV